MPVFLVIFLGLTAGLGSYYLDIGPAPHEKSRQVCASGYVPVSNWMTPHVVCIHGYIPKDEK